MTNNNDLRNLLIKLLLSERLGIESVISILLALLAFVFYSSTSPQIMILQIIFASVLGIIYFVTHSVKAGNRSQDELTRTNIGNINSAINKLKESYLSDINTMSEEIKTLFAANVKLKKDLDEISSMKSLRHEIDKLNINEVD